MQLILIGGESEIAVTGAGAPWLLLAHLLTHLQFKKARDRSAFNFRNNSCNYHGELLVIYNRWCTAYVCIPAEFPVV